MDGNPFSIESILKKNSPSTSLASTTRETPPSKSTEALSLAVKLAGKYTISVNLVWSNFLPLEYFNAQIEKIQRYKLQIKLA